MRLNLEKLEDRTVLSNNIAIPVQLVVLLQQLPTPPIYTIIQPPIINQAIPQQLANLLQHSIPYTIIQLPVVSQNVPTSLATLLHQSTLQDYINEHHNSI